VPWRRFLLEGRCLYRNREVKLSKEASIIHLPAPLRWTWTPSSKKQLLKHWRRRRYIQKVFSRDQKFLGAVSSALCLLDGLFRCCDDVYSLDLVRNSRTATDMGESFCIDLVSPHSHGSTLIYVLVRYTLISARPAQRIAWTGHMTNALAELVIVYGDS
jgi:hypothetical protein